MTNETKEKIANFAKADKVLAKYIDHRGYLSGENTYVRPITIWNRDITILLDKPVSQYVLRGVCKRIASAFPKDVKTVFVGDYDGSCPRELIIMLNV